MCKRRFLALALPLSALLAACGGSQHTTTAVSAGWDSIWDVVPAEATWAFAMDMPDANAEFTRDAWWRALSTEQVGGNPLLSGLQDLGLTIESPEDINGLGIDLGGSVAVFAVDLAPIVVVQLSSPSDFQTTINRVVEQNPDFEESQVSVSGLQMRRFTTWDGDQVDVGVTGTWAVLRFNNSGGQGVDDEALTRALRPTSGARFVERDDVRNLLGRAPAGYVVNQITVLPSTTIAAAVRQLLASNAEGATPQVQALGIRLLEPEYASDAERAACLAAEERLLTTVPGFGLVSMHRESNTGDGISEAVTFLSRAGAERLTGAFRPSVELSDGQNPPAFQVAANIHLPSLLDLVQGDAALRSCPDLGSIAGHLVRLRNRHRNDLAQADQFFTGQFTAALYDFQMAGFLPQVTAAGMMGTLNPASILQLLQRQLEQNGATGTVDETAPLMTIDYRMLGFAFRLIRADDRVVASVGAVDRAQALDLASRAPAPGAPFLIATWDGEQMRPILETGLGLAQSQAGVDDATMGTVREILKPLFAVISGRTTATLDADSITLRMVIESDLDLLRGE